MTDEELLAIIAKVEHGWSQSKDAAMHELLQRKVDYGRIADALRDGTPMECPHGRSIYKLCLICDADDLKGDDDE